VNIAVGSAFRNSAWRLGQYLARVQALRDHAGRDHVVRVIAVEGDSKDNTYELLRTAGPLVSVRKCSHGGPIYGSTERPERMKALSRVGNAIFEAVREDDDVLVYIESDLLWDPHTIGSLIDMAIRRDGGYDVFAPLVFAGLSFYDVWGFRKDGARFAPFPPYHSGLAKTGLTEVDSVGSCLVMRGDVARDVRIENEHCLVGWCESARSKGYRIATHAEFRITHP